MERESETKLKLLRVAKEEFMEKGFHKASLRNICRKAGVTTGAMYFFFRDKADLFGSLVREPVAKIKTIVDDYFKGDIPPLYRGTDKPENLVVSMKILNTLYTYRDSFLLLLTKAEGSGYEKVKEDFTDQADQHYREVVLERKKNKEVSGETVGLSRGEEALCRWIARDQVDSFVYVLCNCETMEEARECLPLLVTYLRGGWHTVMGKK